MNYDAALQQLSMERGLELTPLRELISRATPCKVPCCGGWVVRVYAESAVDSSVVLRDASGTTVCALHCDVVSRYPDLLTAGALLLLVDAAFIPNPSPKMPSFLVAALSNLAGLMLPEEDPSVPVRHQAFASASGPSDEAFTSSVPPPPYGHVDLPVPLEASEVPSSLSPVTADAPIEDPQAMTSHLPGEGDDYDDYNVDCLEFAD